MKLKLLKITAVTYGINFIVCFGLSYNLDYERSLRSPELDCMDNVCRSLLKGALWPLWCSVKLTEGLRKETVLP